MNFEKYKNLETTNTKLSSLRGLDLKQLIYEVENFYLYYRDTLNLDENVTFAPEIEFEGLKDKFPRLKSLGLVDFKLDKDLSLEIDYNGEINTPILRDSKKTWDDLGIICDYLLNENADTCHNAGCHINIGAHIIGNNIKGWDLFCKLWAAYEPVIYRFGFGDKINGRQTINLSARSIARSIYNRKKFFDKEHDLNDLITLWILMDNCAVNLTNIDTDKEIDMFCDGNRVEFKYPNATNDKVVLQNYINFNTKLLLACNGTKIDKGFVDSKFYNLNPDHLYIEYYNEIDLKRGLELVDLVFDNDLDKYYFLRQYLKSSEVAPPFKRGDCAKEVTKKFTKRL